jgi:hypothetical protein
MECMAEKKNDRHRQQPFQLRLHRLLRQALADLAERNASDMTEEIRIAIRERLERAGMWPPPPKGGAA